MVPPGIPVVALLLGGMALLAMVPFPGPSVWQRCVAVAVVVVLAYAAILVSVRRARRASPLGSAVVVGGSLMIMAFTAGPVVASRSTDLSTNWLVGVAASVATAVVFRLTFAVGETLSPKSPVNLVAGVVGSAVYLMALAPTVSLVGQVWTGVGLAAAAGVVLGGVAAWLLAGAQYYFP